jgi:hypothetical protein
MGAKSALLGETPSKAPFQESEETILVYLLLIRNPKLILSQTPVPTPNSHLPTPISHLPQCPYPASSVPS